MSNTRDIQLREYFADLERSREIVIVKGVPEFLIGRSGYVRDTWGSNLVVRLDAPVTLQEAQAAGFDEVQDITHDSRGWNLILPEENVIRDLEVPDWTTLHGVRAPVQEYLTNRVSSV